MCKSSGRDISVHRSVIGKGDGTYFALIGFVSIPPATQVSSEEWLRHVLLGDHVVNGRLLWIRRDGVDGAECQTEKAATVTLIYPLVCQPKPSQERSTCANCCDNCFASSTAWFSTFKPPRSMTSVPTSPLADEPSP